MMTATRSITTRPLWAADLPRLWEMLREVPLANFDDYGPLLLEEFAAQIAERAERELLVAFECDGEFIGAMSYQPASPRSGMLRGVCFAKAVHGSGVPAKAMRSAIAALFADGVEKISAQMFADNHRAWKFFQKLGAVEEGLLRDHTRRAGGAIDVRVFAFFAGEMETEKR